MANDNRKYVGLQVKLEGKDTVKKELQDIFKYVNENKNIKLNIDTSSLNGFKESLTKIESEIGKLASSKIINTDSLKNDVNNIDNVTNKINNLQNTSGKITSTSIKFVDNKAVQDITNLNQGLGKTEKIITDLNTKSQTIIKTDNLQKAEKETQKVSDSYDKLLYKINQFKDKGIFNNSIYNNKTNGLDSMMKNVDFTNLEKASTQIKTISSRLDDLSSKSNKINYIQKALDSFKNSYDNLRKGDNKEIFATLNVSDINSYKKSLNELTKMRNNLMNGAGNNATFKNIDDTINNLKTNLITLQSQFSSNLGIDKMITKAQNSLSKLQLNSSQLNSEVLSRLQQQFNSFNTNTAKSEIQKFIDTTSQLQKTDNNIVKVQNSINKFKNSLDGLKGKYGNLVGNSDSINQLTTFENKIKELESLLTRLKSGNFVNSNSINSTINSANSSFKELTNSVKTSSSAFKLAQQDSISLGQAVQNTLGKFGIYTSLAIACRKVFQEIKEGIQYVKYLDESFTDMSMTISNLTQNQFNEMGKQLDEMAKKMGVTIEAVHDIGRIYSNEQTSTDEILAKTKPTAELSNIAGMDALTASKNMQDIANQFALLEKEGAKASDVFTHIGDTMTAVSRNMTYDFATGIKELSSAISTAGSVAEMSGVSMEKFTSEVGALIEQTGMSGQEVATGYKMISARVLQIKSVAEDLGINDEDMSKAQKALDRLGISIEDKTTGSLKSLDTILEEVGAKWNGLTDVEQQYTSEMLAGNRQRNIFVALMKSMSQQQELYNKAMDSTNALQEANDVKAQSIEGKMNTLKDTVKELWSALINSDDIKGIIDGMTKVSEAMGWINSKIGLSKIAFSGFGAILLNQSQTFKNLRTSLLSTSNIFTSLSSKTSVLQNRLNIQRANIEQLNVSYRKGLISQQEFKASMVSLSSQASATSLKLAGVKMAITALESAFTMGLSFVITELATKLIQFGTALFDTQKRAEEIKQSFEDLSNANSSYDSNSDLIKKYEEAYEKSKDLNLSEEERNQWQEKLKSAKEQLYNLDDKAYGILNNQNKSLSEQLDLLNKINQNKLQEQAKKTDAKLSGIDDNTLSDAKKLINSGNTNMATGILAISSIFGDKQREIEKINEKNEKLAKDLNKYVKVDGGYRKGFTGEIISDDEYKKKQEEISNNVEKIQEYNDKIKELKDTGAEGISHTNVEIANSSKKISEEYKNETEQTKELTKAQQRLKEIKEGKNDVSYNKEEELNNAKNSFNKSVESIEKIQKIINEFGNSKKVDDNTLKEAIDLYPELSAHIDDSAYMVDYLNKKIEEQASTQKEAYGNMMANSEDYFNSNIKNSDEWKNFVESTYEALINSDDAYYRELGEHAKDDFSNCSTLQEAKIELNNYTIKIMAEAWASYYETLTEMQSQHVSSITGQVGMAKDANGNDMIVVEDTTGRGNIKGVGLNEANKKLDDGYSKIEEMQKKYDEAKAKLQATVDNFKGKIGSNITDNKSTSTTVKDYTVENLEDQTDAYYDLNNAITDVQSNIKLLESRYENLYGTAKTNAIRERISLLQQEKDLHSQMVDKINSELAQQRANLSAKGVSFASNGEISNYNQILTSLTNQANAINTVDENTKKAKEDAIKAVKDIKKQMDEYTSTITKDLASQKESWQDLENQIQDTYKTMLQEVQTGESKVSDVIKNEIDKRKKKELDAIDEVKKALQKQWDTDDYEDQLKEAQDKVLEYEDKIKNAISKGDSNSLKDLRKEQQDAINEVNNLVKSHERDMINSGLDDQTDAINKKYDEMEKSQNLTKMVTQALQTGFFEINGEIITLSTSMDSFIKDTTVGLTSINLASRELNENLANAISMLQQFNGYSGVNNLLPDVPYQLLLNSNGFVDSKTVFYDRGTGNSSPTINLGGITVNGNLDNVTLEDMNNTITKRLKDVIGNYIS